MLYQLSLAPVTTHPAFAKRGVCVPSELEKGRGSVLFLFGNVS